VDVVHGAVSGGLLRVQAGFRIVAEGMGRRIRAESDVIIGIAGSFFDVIRYSAKGVRCLCRDDTEGTIRDHVVGVVKSIASIIFGLLLLILVLVVPSWGLGYTPLQRRDGDDGDGGAAESVRTQRQDGDGGAAESVRTQRQDGDGGAAESVRTQRQDGDGGAAESVQSASPTRWSLLGREVSLPNISAYFPALPQLGEVGDYLPALPQWQEVGDYLPAMPRLERVGDYLPAMPQWQGVRAYFLSSAEEPSVVAVDSAQEQDEWELVASSPRELGTSEPAQEAIPPSAEASAGARPRSDSDVASSPRELGTSEPAQEAIPPSAEEPSAGARPRSDSDVVPDDQMFPEGSVAEALNRPAGAMPFSVVVNPNWQPSMSVVDEGESPDGEGYVVA